MSVVGQRLAEQGIELPEVVAAAGGLCPRGAHRQPRLHRWSAAHGQRASCPATGKVGAERQRLSTAKTLARVCALNALAAVHSLVGIDSVTRVIKVVGFVASAPGFNGQPGVINGASELFGEVFGDAGAHARSAVGVSELPLDAPVEVEVIFEVA